ncbi:MAG: 4Fe-4S dicluster domain-containing protein [Dehalococcoidales bacterium]|nr:4Fe-4S dicluster domain-containing protein [Dehalococcoidales bacterium]
MINIENLSQITRFDVDEQPHIILDKEICRNCSHHACVMACPAKCYVFNEETGRMDVAYENCLECGTCMILCDNKAVEWRYPRGGYGVYYRMT